MIRRTPECGKLKVAKCYYDIYLEEHHGSSENRQETTMIVSGQTKWSGIRSTKQHTLGDRHWAFMKTKNNDNTELACSQIYFKTSQSKDSTCLFSNVIEEIKLIGETKKEHADASYSPFCQYLGFTEQIYKFPRKWLEHPKFIF